ncbi:MAG: OmpA family protein [Flavisolibacter sp.]
MFRSLLLPAILLAQVCFAQRSDTLVILYQSDQYTISLKEKIRLDSFLAAGWDQLFINSHTDETDDEIYNLKLSGKRSGEVYKYFVDKKIDQKRITKKYFGESLPFTDNDSEEGKALNRRTEIIGYMYPLISAKPFTDPMLPVTTTLNNGFIITYKPGAISPGLLEDLQAGWGNSFNVVTSTSQMVQQNIVTNTTNNEILSSVLMFKVENPEKCKLGAPVFVRIPLPYSNKCPLQSIKYFVAVWSNGKQIWKEENKVITVDTIFGQPYLGVWMEDLCRFINFDIKLPECYDLDSSRLMYVDAGIRNLTTKLYSVNSLYIPRKLSDSTHSIVYVKNKKQDAGINFVLYNGKRRVKTFRDRPLSEFPYDGQQQAYVLSTDTIRFHFPGIRYGDIYVKVNKDKYRTWLNDSRCEIIYLKKEEESITVDLFMAVSRKKVVSLRGQPLHLLPYDATQNCYVIDKKTIQLLEMNGGLSKR